MLINKEENEKIIDCLYESSNILGSTYNTENKELIIIFSSGRRYKYSDVTKKDYIRFEISESQGKTFNKHIRFYDTTRLDDIDPKGIKDKITEITSQ